MYKLALGGCIAVAFGGLQVFKTSQWVSLTNKAAYKKATVDTTRLAKELKIAHKVNQGKE